MQWVQKNGGIETITQDGSVYTIQNVGNGFELRTWSASRKAWLDPGALFKRQKDAKARVRQASQAFRWMEGEEEGD